jgi:hypothetical protein
MASVKLIKRSLAMKRLAILSFIIGLLGAPIYAQAQQSQSGAPEAFNGLVWDPPIQGHAVGR